MTRLVFTRTNESQDIALAMSVAEHTIQTAWRLHRIITTRSADSVLAVRAPDGVDTKAALAEIANQLTADTGIRVQVAD